ncbi:hypothetical protein M0804_000078 [Polistes exclamans]|nr:hypothetical protein M0804_000078 [Polistes exclamans]
MVVVVLVPPTIAYLFARNMTVSRETKRFIFDPKEQTGVEFYALQLEYKNDVFTPTPSAGSGVHLKNRQLARSRGTVKMETGFSENRA